MCSRSENTFSETSSLLPPAAALWAPGRVSCLCLPYPCSILGLQFGVTTSNMGSRDQTQVFRLAQQALLPSEVVRLEGHVKCLEFLSKGPSGVCHCHQSLHLQKREREGGPLFAPQLQRKETILLIHSVDGGRRSSSENVLGGEPVTFTCQLSQRDQHRHQGRQ